MERLQRAAILTELMDRLRANGSWCGETHVQKAVYFLQEILGVPTGFNTSFTSTGPTHSTSQRTSPRCGPTFSWNSIIALLVTVQAWFPLRRAWSFATVTREPWPTTGPRLSTSPRHSERGESPSLEKLATALYVAREMGETSDPLQRASRMHELKPHVSEAEALTALQEFDRIARDAQSLTPEATNA